MTVTKKQIVNKIANDLKIKQVVVYDVIQSFLDEMIDVLASGDRLEFREFGVFEIVKRKSRVAQNPRTLEKVQVPERRVVKFKPGRLMKKRVENEVSTEPSESVAEPAAEPNVQPQPNPQPQPQPEPSPPQPSSEESSPPPAGPVNPPGNPF